MPTLFHREKAKLCPIPLGKDFNNIRRPLRPEQKLISCVKQKFREPVFFFKNRSIELASRRKVMNMLEKIIKSRLVVEIGSIVFAVLFALWVNEWRSNIKTKNLAKEQTIRIINELEANKIELESVIADNKARLDSLLAFQKQKEWWNLKKLDTIDFGWGYNAAELKKAAWETTLLLNVAPAMDAELLSVLSEIQGLQRLYEEFSLDLLRKFAAETALLKDNLRSAIEKHKYNLFIAQELSGHLLKKYDQFLEKYKKLEN